MDVTLHLRIESSSGVPITRQVVDQIRTQCVSGKLQPGDRLPSVRELARELAVNQNTILRVYERLTAEGFLQRRQGDGTYVADPLPRGQLPSQHLALRDEFSRIVRRARVLGVAADDLHELLNDALAEPEPSLAISTEKHA